jgi:phosphate transport system substrate-binding protein
MKIINSYYIAILLLAFTGCQSGNGNQSERDTPTSGRIAISVDQSFKNLIDSEVLIFHSQYDKAHIDVHYLPEAEALQLFLKDSVRALVIARELTANEKKILEVEGIKLKNTIIAVGGIALIVNPDNPVDKLDVGTLTDIIAGKKTEWSEVEGSKMKGKINIVLDNPGSGVYSYSRDSLLKGAPLGSNVYALKNNQEVIDYIAKHKNSIGLIGVNHVSDMSDVQNQKFTKQVKLLELSDNTQMEGFQPYQAYIATRQYPIIRLLHIYINEPYNGLGSGFAAFAASDKGQRIVLKDGLIPANAPVRLIQVNPSSPNIK